MKKITNSIKRGLTFLVKFLKFRELILEDGWQVPGFFKPSKDGGRNLRTVGLLGAIPLLIGIGPLIGYLIGNWLDNKLGTAPYLMILFIALGFGAAVKETIKIIKKANREPEE